MTRDVRAISPRPSLVSGVREKRRSLYQATRDQAAKVNWRTQKWPESHSNTGKESELSRALTHDVLFGLVH